MEDLVDGFYFKHGFEDQKIFKVLSGKPTNLYLKDIMIKALGINYFLIPFCFNHTWGFYLGKIRFSQRHIIFFYIKKLD